MEFLLDGQAKFSNKVVNIAPEAEIHGAPAVLLERLHRGLEHHRNATGKITAIEFELEEQKGENPEAYLLEIGEKNIRIKAGTEAGLFYGGQTLLRCLEQKHLYTGTVHDVPLTKIRGFKLYLPSPDQAGMKAFCDLVDLLARYKYNYLMLEIGGAMEFRSHPEINQGWVEYCTFMNEYSGKPLEIQEKFAWPKNSIHSTNGGGKVVPQSMVKEMIDYCRERHFEVVPEMPSLSHCDYLLTRHHELAERRNDPYPDTCCPNHPDYYPLLFELFDEVIDVFRPRRMHIGHDEYYSVGICPRCQKQNPPEIYANDIRKCVAFLQSRGVETMIWGEKLLDSHFLNGDACGGAEIIRETSHYKCHIPPIYPAIDMMPEKLQIMHWYWSIDRKLENEFTRRNMPMVFGNFSARKFPELRRRFQAPNCLGFCISNWGATDDRTLQRNGLYFDIVSAAAWAWNPRLDSEDYPEVRDWTLAELFAARHPSSGTWLELLHTCTEEREYRIFVDGWFVDEQRDLLGYHRFRDDNGNEYDFPVIYGTNISGDDVSFERELIGQIEDAYPMDMRLLEVSGETLPEKDSGGRTWYRCRYPHPAPGRKLTRCTFIPAVSFSGKVEYKQE